MGLPCNFILEGNAQWVAISLTPGSFPALGRGEPMISSFFHAGELKKSRSAKLRLMTSSSYLICHWSITIYHFSFKLLNGK